MKTVYDVQQLLKKFGIYIYIGDRLGDLELMELEIAELYKNQLITVEQYKQALIVLKHETAQVRAKRSGI